MVENKNLQNLAFKLRVLKPQEKNKYLYELDRYVQDCYIKAQYLELRDTFFPHRLARSIYYSLEGVPYTQPEFTSQVTERDIEARKKFETFYAGIMAYIKASESERMAFQKSMLKHPSLLKKLRHVMMMRQKSLA